MKATISKLIILSVVIEGFKFFKEPHTFKFNERKNTLKSENESGKTSMLDAITWAFAGVSMCGDIKDLQNDESTEMKVTVEYKDQNGVHTLVRCRNSKGKTTLTIDTVEVNITEFQNSLLGKDIFLSVVNPDYYLEFAKREPTLARQMIYSLLPDVAQEEVKKALPKQTADLLSTENLENPTAYMKARRSEIDELEKSKIHIQGEATVLRTLIPKEDAAIDAIDKEIFTWQENLRKFEAAKANCAEHVKQQRDSLQSQRDAFLKDSKHEKCKEELQRLETEMQKYRDNFSSLSKTLKGIQPDTQCPTCLQTISKEHVSHVANTINNQKVTVYNESLSVKEKVDALKALIDQQTARLADIDAQIAAIEKEYQAAIDKDRIKLERIANGKTECNKQLALLNQKRQQITEIESNKLKLEKAETMISDIVKKISDKTTLINAAKMYEAAKAEILVEKLNGCFDNVRIQLQEVVKSTGEIKDCFKFTYKNLGYSRMSRSGRKKAGIEISQMIRKFAGIDYPLLMDDGESITSFNTSGATQVITTFVAENYIFNKKVKPESKEEQEAA